jgi:hypothetical protein
VTSANRGFGLAISDRARDNLVIHTQVGTNVAGDGAFPNRRGGIVLGPGSSGTTLDGGAQADRLKVAFNRGNGLNVLSSQRNKVEGLEVVDNLGYGLFAIGDCAGTVVRGTTIKRNAAGNVNISRARGIIYVPVA